MRKSLWVIAILVASSVGVLVSSARPVHDAGAADARGGRYYLTPAEVVRIRKNIKRYRWVADAWRNTKQFADQRLNAGPVAPDANGDFQSDPDWRDKLYLPGLDNGHSADALALAYLITGDQRYARVAKGIVLGWVDTYSHPPGVGGGVAPGHMVAEPIGPMIKLFMAADMLRDTFTAGDWARVQRWARQWIAVGEQRADSARDDPWIPDTVVGSFRSNAAPYGNSPMGQRAMAVWAAAIAGPADLSRVLAWNWSHKTPRGLDYSWLNVIDKLVLPGTGGETVEGRERQSLGYGLFAWSELVMIADVARHAGYKHNLFLSRTSSGKSLLSVGPFYGALLSGKKRYPYSAGETFGTKDWSGVSSEFRAVFETVVENCPLKNRSCAPFRAAVRSVGRARRGDDYDGHVLRWNAIVARGW